jgi:hypothetical protein
MGRIFATWAIFLPGPDLQKIVELY